MFSEQDLLEKQPISENQACATMRLQTTALLSLLLLSAIYSLVAVHPVFHLVIFTVSANAATGGLLIKVCSFVVRGVDQKQF